MTKISRSLVLGASALALASCGADEIVSPGTGGNITINNPPAPAPSPAPAPTPTPTGMTGVTPAAGCPTISNPQGLTDLGTISGPTGEYRVCDLPQQFTASSTLQQIDGLLYRIDGQVDVGTDGGPTPDGSDGATDDDVTLRIEPGVILYASGSSFLNVNRGNELQANGTADAPIIFTSRDNVQGLNSDNSSGQWGGVILNGRAPVTDCSAPAAAPGTIDCERLVEGATNPPEYGGATPGDSSGSMRFVQIRYSGFILANGDELQSLTTGGVGSGTTFESIMSVNSSDDGLEFFGGEINMKNVVVIGAEDDSLDTDTGVQANLQYVIAAQRAGAGDTILEGDSNNAVSDDTPRAKTQIANATLIANGAELDQVLRLRGEADFTFVNTLVIDRSPGTPCIRIDLPGTLAAAGSQPDEDGPPIFQSVALDCATDFRDGSDGVTAAQAQAVFDSGDDNVADFVSSLISGYISGDNEDDLDAGDPSAFSSFFDDTDYVGAVEDGNDDRFEGWTCNTATLSFEEDNTGACTSLPTT